jgi:hypothetical protein
MPAHDAADHLHAEARVARATQRNAASVNARGASKPSATAILKISTSTVGSFASAIRSGSGSAGGSM